MEALRSAASRRQSIALGGNFSKRLMGGLAGPADVTISTAGLNRVLQYEPRDLTISVEAGLSYSELTRLLADHEQMIPLDPAFADTATVGGIVATNSSGPRRRLYGTARDLVIGMKFATLEGKLVQSGGMVVKNVAGLDMAKLMIGSFGTLAAIATVNFKLQPRPAVERTFLLPFESLEEAIAVRNAILKSVLQPAAIDLLNPQAAAYLKRAGYILAIQAGGNAAAVERYDRELRALSNTIVLEPPEAAEYWRGIQNFAESFLQTREDAAIARVSCTLMQVKDAIESLPVAAIARAGSGVCYGYFESCRAAAEWAAAAVARGWKAVVEFAPEAQKAECSLWPSPGSDFEMMKKVKHLFDPYHLLNRGRLYGLI